MRIGTVALIFGFTFGCLFCSKTKTHRTVDAVMATANDLLALGSSDPSAFDKLKRLEIEIERAKHKAVADTKALSSYNAAVETFHRSLQQSPPKSVELWNIAHEQLDKAQRERLGIRGPFPNFYDPPLRNPYLLPQSPPKGIVR